MSSTVGRAGLPLAWQPYPAEAPRGIHQFVTAAAQAMCIDLVNVALPMLTVRDAAMGATRAVRNEPRRQEQEPALVWSVLVGEQGSGKSQPCARPSARCWTGSEWSWTALGRQWSCTPVNWQSMSGPWPAGRHRRSAA